MNSVILISGMYHAIFLTTYLTHTSYLFANLGRLAIDFKNIMRTS